LTNRTDKYITKIKRWLC